MLFSWGVHNVGMDKVCIPCIKQENVQNPLEPITAVNREKNVNFRDRITSKPSREMGIIYISICVFSNVIENILN